MGAVISYLDYTLQALGHILFSLLATAAHVLTATVHAAFHALADILSCLTCTDLTTWGGCRNNHIPRLQQYHHRNEYPRWFPRCASRWQERWERRRQQQRCGDYRYEDPGFCGYNRDVMNGGGGGGMFEPGVYYHSPDMAGMMMMTRTMGIETGVDVARLDGVWEPQWQPQLQGGELMRPKKEKRL